MRKSARQYTVSKVSEVPGYAVANWANTLSAWSKSPRAAEACACESVAGHWRTGAGNILTGRWKLTHPLAIAAATRLAAANPRRIGVGKRRLRASLGGVASGRSAHEPDDWPREVEPSFAERRGSAT